jgi:hypothetical protein
MWRRMVPHRVIVYPLARAADGVRPEGTQGQSAPSERATRWLPSRWPEAPPPGRFSR